MWPALVILGIVVLLVLWVMAIYNGLVRLRNRVDNALGQIEVQLKRRYDLIPNLVETVKGYASHEKETLERVVAARNAGLAAQTPGAQAQADNLPSGSCSRWPSSTRT
jgi:LemA protein